MTKLSIILTKRGMTQRDLQRAIMSKYGFKMGDDRISKMVAGKITNVSLRTAKMIADTLDVKIDDIAEIEIVNP